MNSIQHKLYILNNCRACLGYTKKGAGHEVEMCKIFRHYYEISKQHTKYCERMNYKEYVRYEI